MLKKILDSKLYHVDLFTLPRFARFFLEEPGSGEDPPFEDRRYFLTIRFDDQTQKSVSVSAEEAQLYGDGKLDVAVMAKRSSFFTKIEFEDEGEIGKDGVIDVSDASPETMKEIIDFINNEEGMDDKVS